jgi:hypothetical protein
MVVLKVSWCGISRADGDGSHPLGDGAATNVGVSQHWSPAGLGIGPALAEGAAGQIRARDRSLLWLPTQRFSSWS